MLKIVEGLCYLNPNRQVLVATDPTMIGMWRKCLSLLKGEKGAMMAPLLVDDRPFEDALCVQTVDGMLQATTGKTYDSLPWLGAPHSEAELEAQYGNAGCEVLDAVYHLRIIERLALLDPDWKWTVVHPVQFQDQQASMLAELWKRLARSLDIPQMARSLQVKEDSLRASVRQCLFDRFEHYWIGAEDGRVIGHTRPTYSSKRVVHSEL